jgi:hypothetical protein
VSSMRKRQRSAGINLRLGTTALVASGQPSSWKKSCSLPWSTPNLYGLRSTASSLLCDKLRRLAKKFTIDDRVIAYTLILCLPGSYSTLRAVLRNTGSSKLTSKWVAYQILAEEYRLVQQSGGSATAFYTKTKRAANLTNPKRSAHAANVKAMKS